MLLRDDSLPEPDETIAVRITSVCSGYVIASPDTATVTILANDDPYGILAFDNVSELGYDIIITSLLPFHGFTSHMDAVFSCHTLWMLAGER